MTMVSQPPWVILRRAVQYRSWDDEEKVDIDREDVVFCDNDNFFIAKSPAVMCLTLLKFVAEWGSGRLPYVVSADPSGTLLVSVGGYFEASDAAACRACSLIVLRGFSLQSSSAACVKISAVSDRASPISLLSNIGLVVLPDNSGACIVAELERLETSDKAKLSTIRSNSGGWTEAVVTFPKGPSTCWAPHCVISHNGNLCWVDLTDGIILCDLSLDNPVLLFEVLPKGNLTMCTSDDVRTCRSIGVSNRMLRFVEIGQQGSDWHVSVWTLWPDGLGCTGHWRKLVSAPLIDIAGDISYKRKGLPAFVPSVEFLHPKFPGVVYCSQNEHLFSVDVCGRKVVDHVLRSQLDSSSSLLSWVQSSGSAEDAISCLSLMLDNYKSVLSLSELKIEAIMLVVDSHGGMLSRVAKERLIDFLDSVRVIETSLDSLLDVFPIQQIATHDSLMDEIQFSCGPISGDDLISEMRNIIKHDIFRRLPSIIRNVKASKDNNLDECSQYLKKIYASTSTSTTSDDVVKAVMDEMVSSRMVSKTGFAMLECNMKESLMSFRANNEAWISLETVLDTISLIVSNEGQREPCLSSFWVKEQALKIISSRKAMKSVSQAQARIILDTLKVMLSVDEALKSLEDVKSGGASNTSDEDDKNDVKVALLYQDVSNDLIGEIYDRLKSEIATPLPDLMSKIESDMTLNIMQFKVDLEVLYASSNIDEPTDVTIFDRVMRDGHTNGLGADIGRMFRLFNESQNNLKLTKQALQVVCDLIEKPEITYEKRERLQVSHLQSAKTIAALLKTIHEDAHDDGWVV